MNRIFSFEDFVHSPKARFVRRSIPFVALAGIAGDWYVMHRREIFPREEGEWFVVDYSVIGRPRPVMYVLPTAHYTVYSPWTPVNGDVVFARRVEGYENWIQLIGGRYLERQTCGVELCTTVAAYEKRHGALSSAQWDAMKGRSVGQSTRQAGHTWSQFLDGVRMVFGSRQTSSGSGSNTSQSPTSPPPSPNL